MSLENLARMARRVVAATLDELPAAVRGKVREVPIFLEAHPDEGDLSAGIEPDTLGYFDEGAFQSPTPRIRLWLENIWDYAEGEQEVFCEEVRTTLLHEIGHFLGWDEEDVEDRGLG